MVKQIKNNVRKSRKWGSRTKSYVIVCEIVSIDFQTERRSSIIFVAFCFFLRDTWRDASFRGEKWRTTGGWRYSSRVQATDGLTDKRTMRTRNAPQSQTWRRHSETVTATTGSGSTWPFRVTSNQLRSRASRVSQRRTWQTVGRRSMQDSSLENFYPNLCPSTRSNPSTFDTRDTPSNKFIENLRRDSRVKKNYFPLLKIFFFFSFLRIEFARRHSKFRVETSVERAKNMCMCIYILFFANYVSSKIDNERWNGISTRRCLVIRP